MPFVSSNFSCALNFGSDKTGRSLDRRPSIVLMIMAGRGTPAASALIVRYLAFHGAPVSLLPTIPQQGLCRKTPTHSRQPTKRRPVFVG